MAWETVDLLPLITSDFNGSDYVMEDASGYRNPGTGNLNDNITPVQIETSFWDSYEANDYIIGDSNAGIRFNGTGNSGISLMLSGTAIVTISLNSGWGLKPFVLVAGINRETERGSIFMVNRYYDFPEGASSYSDTYRNDAQGSFLNDNGAYQALTGIIASPYTWTAVESISGRLGTLNLTQIKSDFINDGSAVTGASSSNFDNLVEANGLKALITAVLPEPTPSGTDVTVQYNIGSSLAGSYTYCKLVVKKNKIPNDITDGNKIIDLDPTKSSVVVNNLSGKTKYYFVIFVKDRNNMEASSEPKSITTGEAHDIMLFTNEFNEDVLPEGWSLSNYKSGYGNANSNWGPQQFSSDYLSAYNFLIGNASRRMMYIENGELVADQETGMTDTILWIPVQRSIVPEEFKLEFDGKVSPTGYSYYDYNYTGMCVGCVDENNGWHQSAQASGVTGNDFTHYEANIANWTYGYIDYIGLSCCDGKPHFKNIQVTVG